MPAHVKPKQKPKSTSLARMLAHITFGFGITTGATLFAPSAFGQACDKCSGMSAPSCGCELSSSKHSAPKHSAPKHSGPKPCSCVRKPSVGELILDHFDRVGDQIEARGKQREKGATSVYDSPQGPRYGCESVQGTTCGCKAPKSPSCGCEVCSPTDHFPRTNHVQSVPAQLPPIQSASLSPNVGPTAPAAKGVLVDKQNNVSAHPIAKQPLVGKQDLNTSDHAVEHSEPKVQRVPFENRTLPANPINRNADIETGNNTTTPSITNVLKPVPLDTPPAWTPNAIPPKATTTDPIDSELPDVFVDPFKDDVSSKGKNKSLIQLTSDRQISTNTLRSGLSNYSDADPQDSLTIERPAKLTPKQKRSTSQESASVSLQFEASESTSNAEAKVVSSSYLHSTPAPVVVRKASTLDKPTGAPTVSKVRVPTKR
ncbi:MAG: hypothetical protein NTY15_00920 [Planctomycetota bacterium]|nr:hypothetical protein [Planctomycetota bacterium]